MAVFKAQYDTHAALMWTSLASLANSAYSGCLAVDNGTNLYEDVQVSGFFKTGGSATAGTVIVYAYGTTDGTNYTDGATGTDAAQTPTSPTNLIPIGYVNMPASNNVAIEWGPFPISRAFGRFVPRKWGLVAYNNACGTLNASGSSGDMIGIWGQSV
jgi:hypothetical protein